MNARDLQTRLRSLANPADAAFLAGFFKTGPGEYGAGDVLIGVRVPVIRKLATEFKSLGPLSEIERLLHSKVHEARLAALIILVMQFAEAGPATRKASYHLYLANTALVNNWDLVDVSAPHVVGGFLADKSRRPLDRLARSAWLWDRRISLLATFHFIRRGQFADTLRIAELLLADPHDLIHKAAGWMLREVGKRDVRALERFLARHGPSMPRTMLRYAIERFPADRRNEFLAAGTDCNSV